MARKWVWVGAAAFAVAALSLPALGIGVGQLLVFLLVLLCPLLHWLGVHRHGAGETGRAEGPAPGASTGEAPGQER